jgi:Mn-containing catalase
MNHGRGKKITIWRDAKMWIYEKKLQYPVRIKNPNPKMAKYIITQYGGPDGELAASLRYLSQRYHMPIPEAKAVLNDIGTSLTILLI